VVVRASIWVFSPIIPCTKLSIASTDVAQYFVSPFMGESSHTLNVSSMAFACGESFEKVSI